MIREDNYYVVQVNEYQHRESSCHGIILRSKANFIAYYKIENRI